MGGEGVQKKGTRFDLTRKSSECKCWRGLSNFRAVVVNA